MGNLIPEGADLGVLGVLVILALLNGGLKVLDLFPQPSSISGDLQREGFKACSFPLEEEEHTNHFKEYNLGSGLLDLVDLVVLALDPGVGGINLLLQVVLGSLKSVGLVNYFLKTILSWQREIVSLMAFIPGQRIHPTAEQEQARSSQRKAWCGSQPLRCIGVPPRRCWPRRWQSSPRTPSCTFQTECTSGGA